MVVHPPLSNILVTGLFGSFVRFNGKLDPLVLQHETYASNAASIYVEKAEHLTVRNCVLHDSGNGLFIGAYDGASQNILIERNHIFDNGIENSYYQHNTYTAAIHITYTWLPTGWVTSHSGFDGTLIDHGTNIEGTDPGFTDFAAQDFSPAQDSPLLDAGGTLNPETDPDHLPEWQYRPHQLGFPRPNDGARDLGAFEYGLLFSDGFESGDTSGWSATTPRAS